MRIFIPSHQRPNALLIKKLIFAEIPFVIVIDHKDDLPLYAHLQNDITYVAYVDGNGKGIGYVRQKIKETYNGEPIIMLDDDTSICLRKFDNPTSLTTCQTKEQIREWFDIVDDFCKKNSFDIGSVADSVYKWNLTEKVLRKGSLCSVTIFNSPRVHEIDYDPNVYARMEDHDLILQAIEHKFDFLICNDVVRHCPMNKEAKDKGGCSSVYRNDKIMKQTTEYMLKKYGNDIVKLSDRKKIGNAPDFTIDYKLYRNRHGYNY